MSLEKLFKNTLITLNAVLFVALANPVIIAIAALIASKGSLPSHTPVPGSSDSALAVGIYVLQLVTNFTLIAFALLALFGVCCAASRTGRFLLWLDLFVKVGGILAYAVIMGLVVNVLVQRVDSLPPIDKNGTKLLVDVIPDITNAVWAQGGLLILVLLVCTIMFQVRFLVFLKRRADGYQDMASVNQSPWDM